MKINKVFKPLFLSKSRYNILWGGRGSGKSVAATNFVLLRVIKDNINALVVRKYAASLRRSVLAEFETQIKANNWTKDFEINVSPAQIKCLLNDNKIHFVGLDDTEKLKSIPNISLIFIEEANELDEDDFLSLDAGLRTNNSLLQIVLCFNPISEFHWLKRRFFDSEWAKNARIEGRILDIHSTYRDNNFIDKMEYERTLKSMSDSRFYLIFANGEWGSFSGKILNDFTLDNVVENYELDGSENISFVFDWGITNPSVVSCFATRPNGDTYLYKQLYRKNMLISDIAAWIKSQPEYNYVHQFIADPAIKARERDGRSIYDDFIDFSIFFQLADNNFEQGIVKLNQSFRDKKLFISRKCTNTLNEIASYVWDDKGKAKGDDHAIDTLRYFVNSVDVPVVRKDSRPKFIIALELEEERRRRREEILNRYEFIIEEPVSPFED
jgi:phage terminase large subunit